MLSGYYKSYWTTISMKKERLRMKIKPELRNVSLAMSYTQKIKADVDSVDTNPISTRCTQEENGHHSAF